MAAAGMRPPRKHWNQHKTRDVPLKRSRRAPAGSRALGVQRGARVQRARHGVQHLPPELAVQQEAAVRGAGVAQHLPPPARPSAAPPGPLQAVPPTAWERPALKSMR